MNQKHYALIGDPLGHSMSAVIHKCLFLLKNIRADYALHPVASGRLCEEAPFLRSLSGFNVTIPHKRAVMELLDEVSDKAALYGAVNTVICSGGTMKGDNTDCEGFLRALQSAGIPLSGEVLVCGAGGVARMIAFECAMKGCEVTIATRESSAGAAREIAREISEKVPFASVRTCLFSELHEEYDLLANGTPVGMYPNCGSMVVPPSVLANCKAVFDTVYNPLETALVRTARELGIPAQNGLSMLVWQAAAAQERWLPAAFTQEEIQEVLDYTEQELTKTFGG